MAEHTLFQADDILVTPKIATFGHVTFQVSNIASVALFEARKINSGTIFLGLIGALAVVAAFVIHDRNPSEVHIPIIVALVAILAAVIWQTVWPTMEFKFLLRLANGDSHAIVSNDRARSEQLRDAIAEAFTLRA